MCKEILEEVFQEDNGFDISSTSMDLVVFFLSGSWNYRMQFWGHVYYLRVVGKPELELGTLLGYLKHSYRCFHNVSDYALQKTPKYNLRFLHDLYDTKSALTVETLHDVIQWVPRSMPYTLFKHVVVQGVPDTAGHEKGLFSVRLGSYPQKKLW